MANALRLNIIDRTNLLTAITARLVQFPRATIRRQLEDTDIAYHMQGKQPVKDKTNESVQTSHRYDEMDVAIVRPITDTDNTYYINTFLSGATIFETTSDNEHKEPAEQMNAIMEDQERKMGWSGNLTRALFDAAKHNKLAVDLIWDNEIGNTLVRDADTGTVKLEEQKLWEGNNIHHISQYNAVYDTSVEPNDVTTKGEFMGYVEQYTQVRLVGLTEKLKEEDALAYYDSEAMWGSKSSNLTKLQGNGQGTSDVFSSYVPQVLRDKTQEVDEGMNWAKHFGTSVGHLQRKGVVSYSPYYEVMKLYYRMVPEAYGLNVPSAKKVQTWVFYIVNGQYIMFAKRLNLPYNTFPAILCQPLADDLRHNTLGPAQVALAHQHVGKQFQDRVLAAFDRMINDRMIYDQARISKTDMNTRYPDGRIPAKPGMKKLDDLVKVLPSNFAGIGDLIKYGSDIKVEAKEASGQNRAQEGQFQRGNKTLGEFREIMGNASGRQFARALAIENMFMSPLKRMIKLNNLLNWGDARDIFAPSVNKKVKIDPKGLNDVELDFKLADGLKPTEDMINEQVFQMFLQLVTLQPQWFANYDIAALIIHTIQQSMSINMSQFKLETPNPVAQTGATNG